MYSTSLRVLFTFALLASASFAQATAQSETDEFPELKGIFDERDTTTTTGLQGLTSSLNLPATLQNLEGLVPLSTLENLLSGLGLNLGSRSIHAGAGTGINVGAHAGVHARDIAADARAQAAARVAAALGRIPNLSGLGLSSSTSTSSKRDIASQLAQLPPAVAQRVAAALTQANGFVSGFGSSFLPSTSTSTTTTASKRDITSQLAQIAQFSPALAQRLAGIVAQYGSFGSTLPSTSTSTTTTSSKRDISFADNARAEAAARVAAALGRIPNLSGLGLSGSTTTSTSSKRDVTSQLAQLAQFSPALAQRLSAIIAQYGSFGSSLPSTSTSTTTTSSKRDITSQLAQLSQFSPALAQRLSAIIAQYGSFGSTLPSTSTSTTTTSSKRDIASQLAQLPPAVAQRVAAALTQANGFVSGFGSSFLPSTSTSTTTTASKRDITSQLAQLAQFSPALAQRLSTIIAQYGSFGSTVPSTTTSTTTTSSKRDFADDARAAAAARVASALSRIPNFSGMSSTSKRQLDISDELDALTQLPGELGDEVSTLLESLPLLSNN